METDQTAPIVSNDSIGVLFCVICHFGDKQKEDQNWFPRLIIA